MLAQDTCALTPDTSVVVQETCVLAQATCVLDQDSYIRDQKSENLMVKIFGPEVRDINFFRYKKLIFEGREMIVARSGFSKQGGFEIYVNGFDYGMPLWDDLMSKGREFNVRVGCPNLIERIEGGLLSYGNDITRDNTPFEAGLSRFVNSKENYIGRPTSGVIIIC